MNRLRIVTADNLTAKQAGLMNACMNRLRIVTADNLTAKQAGLMNACMNRLRIEVTADIQKGLDLLIYSVIIKRNYPFQTDTVSLYFQSE